MPSIALMQVAENIGAITSQLGDGQAMTNAHTPYLAIIPRWIPYTKGAAQGGANYTSVTLTRENRENRENRGNREIGKIRKISKIWKKSKQDKIGKNLEIGKSYLKYKKNLQNNIQI